MFAPSEMHFPLDAPLQRKEENSGAASACTLIVKAVFAEVTAIMAFARSKERYISKRVQSQTLLYGVMILLLVLSVVKNEVRIQIIASTA